MTPAEVLSGFHPAVRDWFGSEFRAPSDVQLRAWPEIAAGRHVLATAPTGSGKTLAAFLWAIHQLISGVWEAGGVRVLYVSPLKALGADIQRNLDAPLSGISRTAAKAGIAARIPRVAMRSGDSTGTERRSLLRYPPEILVTTPESLNIMLTGRHAPVYFAGVRCVILDEIHAVAGSHRGVHLMTGVERLCHIAGEVQRVALSATVEPVSVISRFVGGFGQGGRARPVTVLQSQDAKDYRLLVEHANTESRDSFWADLTGRVTGIVEQQAPVLVFANSRRHAEHFTLRLNENRDAPLAWAHHGSLSREVRQDVEERLKSGTVPAIVSTSTLELGIDVGSLRHVILLGSPPDIGSALQRLGRAGHQVGAPSSGTLFPLHGRELVDAAMIAAGVRDRAIEEISPPRAPLDILSQVILSMVANRDWHRKELLGVLRGAWSYAELPEPDLDEVLRMLSGFYENTRIPELRPRLDWDRETDVITAREGADRLVYLSGGSIPDRGYYRMRAGSGGPVLAELDEEFVFERKSGDSFVMGTRLWTITRITDSEVEVKPGGGASRVIPFWKAEQRNRPFATAERVLKQLQRLGALDAAAATDDLRALGFSDGASEALLAYLQKQRDHAGGLLPARTHLVIEGCDGGRGGTPFVMLHSLWGGRINHPLAICLTEYFRARDGRTLTTSGGDDGIIIQCADVEERDEILAILEQGLPFATRDLDELLRSGVERTGLFGARFREAAGRALLLPRRGFKRRQPLWVSRQRAKDLFERLRDYPNFPIVREAWRALLQDEFDLPGLRKRMEELSDGSVGISGFHSFSPSPFAESALFWHTESLMYASDAPGPAGGSAAAVEQIIADALQGAVVAVPRAAVDAVRGRLQRRDGVWASRDAQAVSDWLAERLWATEAEYQDRLARLEPDPASGDALQAPIRAGDLAAKLKPGFVISPLQAARLAAAVAAADPAEYTPEQADGEADDLSDILGEWLRWTGAIPVDALATSVPLPEALLDAALSALLEDGTALRGNIVADDGAQWLVHLEAYEAMVRQARRDRRQSVDTRPGELLARDLAQRLLPIQSVEARAPTLQDALLPLLGYPAPQAVWERIILPMRTRDYRAQELSRLIREEGLRWIGAGSRRVAFVLDDELDVFLPAGPGTAAEEVGHQAGTLLDALSNAGETGADRAELAQRTGLRLAEVDAALQELAAAGRVSSDQIPRFHVPSPKGDASSGPAPGSPGMGGGTRGGVRRRDHWRSGRAGQGDHRTERWFMLPQPAEPDSLEAQELGRQRARVLLDRYGIVFRALCERELPGFRWARIAQSLRLMELAGEVVGGVFYQGLDTLQFARESDLAALSPATALEGPGLWLVNSMDPASACGLGLPGGPAVARAPGTWLGYRGTKLVLEIRREGRAIDSRNGCSPGELATLMLKLARMPGAGHRILVEEIDGVRARESEAAQALLSAGFRDEYRHLVYLR